MLNDRPTPRPPRPIGTQANQYLFEIPGEGILGLTFLQLANRDVLIRLCGGDDRWLRASFPKTYMLAISNGVTQRVPAGINALDAARYVAGLAIDAESRRRVAAAQPFVPLSWTCRWRRWRGAVLAASGGGV